jgi:hypothetical protein
MSSVAADPLTSPSQAAERRQRDENSCGAGHAHGGQLPPEIQAEVNQAAKDSRSVMIDLTKDFVECDDAAYGDGFEPSNAEASGSGSGIKVKEEDDDGSSSSDLEILPAVPAKRRAPSRSTFSSSSIELAPAARPLSRSTPRPPIANGARLASKAFAEPASSTPKPAWTCPTCTFDNLSPLSLACELCLTERPENITATVAPVDELHTTNARTVVGGRVRRTIELDEGWA